MTNNEKRAAELAARFDEAYCSGYKLDVAAMIGWTLNDAQAEGYKQGRGDTRCEEYRRGYDDGASRYAQENEFLRRQVDSLIKKIAEFDLYTPRVITLSPAPKGEE